MGMVHAEVAENADIVRRHIGFVSTNTAVYDRMTAWEMVEYFGRLNGIEPEPLRDRMEARRGGNREAVVPEPAARLLRP